jgi:hypothetical protein
MYVYKLCLQKRPYCIHSGQCLCMCTAVPAVQPLLIQNDRIDMTKTGRKTTSSCQVVSLHISKYLIQEKINVMT